MLWLKARQKLRIAVHQEPFQHPLGNPIPPLAVLLAVLQHPGCLQLLKGYKVRPILVFQLRVGRPLSALRERHRFLVAVLLGSLLGVPASPSHHPLQVARQSTMVVSLLTRLFPVAVPRVESPIHPKAAGLPTRPMEQRLLAAVSLLQPVLMGLRHRSSLRLQTLQPCLEPAEVVRH